MWNVKTEKTTYNRVRYTGDRDGLILAHATISLAVVREALSSTNEIKFGHEIELLDSSL